MTIATAKGPTDVIYQLWLDHHGTPITLRGWSLNDAGRTEHWPAYPLCDEPDALPGRLAELGLTLHSGASLDDLPKGWDVYLRHPDPGALRSELDGG